jgi:hypothetical protein
MVEIFPVPDNQTILTCPVLFMAIPAGFSLVPVIAPARGDATVDFTVTGQAFFGGYLLRRSVTLDTTILNCQDTMGPAEGFGEFLFCMVFGKYWFKK